MNRDVIVKLAIGIITLIFVSVFIPLVFNLFNTNTLSSERYFDISPFNRSNAIFINTTDEGGLKLEMINETSYNAIGSYYSGICDLGNEIYYFYYTLTTYLNTSTLGTIDLLTSVSMNKLDWTPFSPTPLNFTFNMFGVRYFRIIFNLTASIDLLDSPYVLQITMHWRSNDFNTIAEQINALFMLIPALGLICIVVLFYMEIKKTYQGD